MRDTYYVTETAEDEQQTDFEYVVRDATGLGWRVDHTVTDRGSRTWVRPGEVEGWDVKMWFGDDGEWEDAFQGALLSRRYGTAAATVLRFTDDMVEATKWLRGDVPDDVRRLVEAE